jgi:hypothetical protein
VIGVLREASERGENGDRGQGQGIVRLHGSVYGADPRKVP